MGSAVQHPGEGLRERATKYWDFDTVLVSVWQSWLERAPLRCPGVAGPLPGQDLGMAGFRDGRTRGRQDSGMAGLRDGRNQGRQDEGAAFPPPLTGSRLREEAEDTHFLSGLL